MWQSGENSVSKPELLFDQQLKEILNKTRVAYGSNGISDEYEEQLKAAITSLTRDIEQAARIDENESILSVAEHEISLPDHCYMHDTYSSNCQACKKRKWYGEISKDWKRVINERIKELRAALPAKDTK